MVVETPKRYESEKSFAEFCEFLLRKDGTGIELRPSKLGQQAYRAAVDPGEDVKHSQDQQDRNYDRAESARLLADVEIAGRDFPKVAGKYHDILSKAKGIWRTLAG